MKTLRQIRERLARRRPPISFDPQALREISTRPFMARYRGGQVLANGSIVAFTACGTWPISGGAIIWIAVDDLIFAQAHGWRAQRDGAGEPMVAAPNLVAVSR